MRQMQPSMGATVYTGYVKFFRLKLLTLNNDEVEKLVESYEKQSDALRDEALRLAWHMRGSVSYEHALMLSSTERNMIGKIIKENFETVKKTGLPYF